MMDSLNTRVFLGIALIFLGATLWGQWQAEQASDATASNPEMVTDSSGEVPLTSSGTVPTDDLVPQAISPSVPSHPSITTQISKDRIIHIETDVFSIDIDKKGGDIVSLELIQYPEKKVNPDIGFQLLDRSDQKYYIAQTGLIHVDGPDFQKERATFVSEKSSYKLEGDELVVELFWRSDKGVEFTKTFKFERGSYLVKVGYQIHNPTQTDWVGKLYGRIQRQPWTENGKGLVGMQTYQGGAFFTPDKKFKKVSFKDMKEDNFSQTITGGWAAMVEHYFVTAWVPNADAQNEYYSSVSSGDRYNVGALTTVHAPPGQTVYTEGQLYMGPEVQETLESISPGLELTVDYGILWPISSAIFYVMKLIHSVLGNWGWSIIAVTLFIKALFYKLSAASYRSMGHLRRVQPRIEQMKQKYGDDKQRFSQAMMELYKKEKINPLGGCLPILIQIPVFIALYYVLLESVELRQAPFMLWIQDLSSKDPFYVLPLLMGASMLVQQKLSPAPPDPMQARILMFMPVIFTVLFLSFPAGLVLYWVVNNVLSILQQWLIMRNLNKEGLGRSAANQPSKAKG